MSDHDDFTVEPVEGLPEVLPDGETILWQGRPQTRTLAREALGLNWVLGYFAVIAIWRTLASTASMPLTDAMGTAIPFLILGMVTAAIILLIARIQSRATVYTITTHRVAMRIGAALTLTLNMPFKKIASADLDLRRGGTGTIALKTTGQVKLSYMVLWPHIRPWHMKDTQPALRCIPDAKRVAGLLSEAVDMRVNQPTIERHAPLGAVAAE